MMLQTNDANDATVDQVDFEFCRVIVSFLKDCISVSQVGHHESIGRYHKRTIFSKNPISLHCVSSNLVLRRGVPRR